MPLAPQAAQKLAVPESDTLGGAGVGVGGGGDVGVGVAPPPPHPPGQPPQQNTHGPPAPLLHQEQLPALAPSVGSPQSAPTSVPHKWPQANALAAFGGSTVHRTTANASTASVLK